MQYVRLCILTAHYLHRALESINKLSAGPFLAVEEAARGVRCQLKFKRLLSIQCSTPETAVSLNWPVTRLYLSQQQTHTHSIGSGQKCKQISHVIKDLKSRHQLLCQTDPAFLSRGSSCDLETKQLFSVENLQSSRLKDMYRARIVVFLTFTH